MQFDRWLFSLQVNETYVYYNNIPKHNISSEQCITLSQWCSYPAHKFALNIVLVLFTVQRQYIKEHLRYSMWIRWQTGSGCVTTEQSSSQESYTALIMLRHLNRITFCELYFFSLFIACSGIWLAQCEMHFDNSTTGGPIISPHTITNCLASILSSFHNHHTGTTLTLQLFFCSFIADGLHFKIN